MGKGVDKSKKKDKQQKERAIRLQISEDSRVKQACHDKWRDRLNPVVGDLGFDRLEVGFEDHDDEQQHENDENDEQQHENDENEQDENDEQQHENDENEQDENDEQQHENDEQQHERDQQQHEDDQRDHQREDDQQDQQDIPDEADLLLGGPAPPGAARPGPAPHH